MCTTCSATLEHAANALLLQPQKCPGRMHLQLIQSACGRMSLLAQVTGRNKVNSPQVSAVFQVIFQLLERFESWSVIISFDTSPAAQSAKDAANAGALGGWQGQPTTEAKEWLASHRAQTSPADAWQPHSSPLPPDSMPAVRQHQSRSGGGGTSSNGAMSMSPVPQARVPGSVPQRQHAATQPIEPQPGPTPDFEDAASTGEDVAARLVHGRPPTNGKADVDCSLCLEYLLQANIACPPCGHVFHLPCLETMVQARQQCPLCEVPCTPAQIFKLYF